MTNGLSFGKWLSQYRAEKTDLGDLARQVAADPEWQEPASLAALESYLMGAGRSQHVLDTARRAWRRYAADSGAPRRR